MVLTLGNDPDIITRLDAYLGGIISAPWDYPIAPAYYLGIRSYSIAGLSPVKRTRTILINIKH